MGKISLTYRFLKKYKIIVNEKYSNISLIGAIIHIFRKILVLLVYKYSYSSTFLEPLNLKIIRAKCWQFIGCKINKNVIIGRYVDFDYGNSNLITLEDNVIITNGCTLLCHKRDLANYNINDDGQELPYIYNEIILKKGCQIGINSTIMPGVTIGEGAIVGACSLVAKDIPAWSIAVGNPAKVVKYIKNKEDENIANNQ